MPGIGRGRIRVVTKLGGRIELSVHYAEKPLPSLAGSALKVFPGERILVEAENGTVTGIDAPEGIEVRGRVLRFPQDAEGKYDVLVSAGTSVLPLSVETVRIPKPEKTVRAGKMEPLDISEYFNCALTEVHNRKFLSPRPEGYSIGVRINGRYAWEWNHYGHNALRVEDTLLRQAGGTFTVPSGAKFLTPETGNNVLTLSVWDNFPSEKVIPLSGKAKRLHLFLCGTTNAMQTDVVNARCTVVCKDGSEKVLDLVQPKNFDDFLIPSYQLEAEPFYVSDGTHGLHLVMELDPDQELAEIRLESVANEVILMLLGITLERAD